MQRQYGEKVEQFEVLLSDYSEAEALQLDNSYETSGISSPFNAKSAFSNRLCVYDQLQRGRMILEDVRNNIPQKINQNTKRHRMYLIIFLAVILVSILMPSGFFTLMFNMADSRYRKKLPDWKTKLDRLDAEWNFANKMFNQAKMDYHNLPDDILYEKVDNVIALWQDKECDAKFKDEYHKSFTSTGDIGPNRGIIDFCNIATNYKLKDESCQSVSEHGCEVMKSDDQYLAMMRLSDRSRLIAANMTRIDSEHDEISYYINHRLNPETIEPVSITLFAGASIIAIGALIYSAIFYNRKRHETKYELEYMQNVITHLKNSTKLNEIINIASRLEIDLVTATLTTFITRIEEELNNLKKNSERRVAFLSGQICPAANNYQFFKTGGWKDITKMIFKEAQCSAENPMKR